MSALAMYVSIEFKIYTLVLCECIPEITKTPILTYLSEIKYSICNMHSFYIIIVNYYLVILF